MTTDPPDDIPIHQFMLDDSYGRYPLKKSKNPFTCGLSGRTFTGVEMAERVEFLARALSKEFEWQPNVGTEWDKVAGIFALNTVSNALKKKLGILTDCSTGRFYDIGLCSPPTQWNRDSSEYHILCL